MKKVLVTGGTAAFAYDFIALAEGKYDLSVAGEDIDLCAYPAVKALIKQVAPDAVVHCIGARSGADELTAFRAVQQSALLCGVRKLIVLGDPADIDDTHGYDLVPDGREDMPSSAYGKARYLLRRLAERDKITTYLRVFGHFGKGSSIDCREVEILSHALTGKKEIALPCNCEMSYIYGEDLARLIVHFIESEDDGSVYNIAAPTPVSLYDFAKKAKSYAKKEGRDVYLTLGEGTMPPRTAKVDALLARVGTFKFTAAGTAMNKTLDYFKTHKSRLRGGK